MARKDHPDARTRLVISRIISFTTGLELVPSIAWEDQTVKQPVLVYWPLYCRFTHEMNKMTKKKKNDQKKIIRIYTFGFFVTLS